MAIIISKNGKDAVKVDPSDFQLEDQLQEYIYNNPEAVPLYEINEDIRLLVLAREFPTGSGPIDALGVDQSGQIYLIETKLYKNSDKRLVVAQVLDYGASLWRHSVNFDEFVSTLSSRSQHAFGMSLERKLQDYFDLDIAGTDLLLTNVQKNLNTGTFKFVVLMDKLHDRLRDLIVYMNSNSNFDIYAVELEYYRHNDLEIIIPKLYGAEVKKEVKTSRKGLTLSEEEIVQGYSAVGLGGQIADFLSVYNGLKNGDIEITNICVSHGTTKYLSLMQNDDSITSANLYISPERVPQIDVWVVKEKEDVVAKALKALGVEPKPIKKSSGKIGKIPLQSFNKTSFLTFLEALGQA
jgi:hypothetical protein